MILIAIKDTKCMADPVANFGPVIVSEIIKLILEAKQQLALPIIRTGGFRIPVLGTSSTGDL